MFTQLSRSVLIARRVASNSMLAAAAPRFVGVQKQNAFSAAAQHHSSTQYHYRAFHMQYSLRIPTRDVPISLAESQDWSKLTAVELQAIFADAPTVQVQRSLLLENPITTVLKETKIMTSASEVKQVVQKGGLQINNARVDSPDHMIKEKDVVDGKVVVLRINNENYVLDVVGVSASE